MINIMLVDDQKSMITGLKALLSTHEDFAVVATAASGAEALAILQNAPNGDARAADGSPPFPDVVLMDIRMPNMNGVEATKAIKERYPEVTILILTTFDDDEYIIDALHYGAAGYLLKDIGGKRLIESIYEALSGNLLLTGRVASKLAHSIRQQQSAAIPQQLNLTDLQFSEREIEIAEQIMLGLNAREISEKTFLSLGTVKNYTSSIYAKLGVNDRSKAIVLLRDIFQQE